MFFMDDRGVARMIQPLSPNLPADQELIRYAAAIQSRGQLERARLILEGIIVPEQFRRSPRPPTPETSPVYRAMERVEARERRVREEAKKAREDWTDALPQ